MRRLRSSAFTLVELLISIGIALMLIVGVNAVFRASSQTVGTGQSLLAVSRDVRSLLRTMFNDLTNVNPVPIQSSVGTAPCFIIMSQHQYAFRNLADQQGSTNRTDPSTDLNLFSNTTLFPGSQCPVPYLQTRSYRVDRLGFFSQRLCPRQTSSDSKSYVSVANDQSAVITSSQESWVMYGHTRQPNKDAMTNGATPAWFDPGALTDQFTPAAKNDNFNFNATDWMLGRTSMLFSTAAGTGVDTTYLRNVYDSGNSANSLWPLVGKQPTSPTSSNWGTGAFQQNESSANGPSPTPYMLSDSRYDIAHGTVDQWSKQPGGINSAGYSPTGNGPNYGQNWWSPLIAYRFHSSPFILPDPKAVFSVARPKITPYGLAVAAPNLLRGCSHFVVEYAGNFYTKDTLLADGTPSAYTHDKKPYAQNFPVPDATGELDYFVNKNDPDPNKRNVRRVRWYGYPRWLGSRTAAGAPTFDPQQGDVVPFRDVLSYYNASWGAMDSTRINTAQFADAERFSANFPAPTSGGWTNYLTALSASTDQSSNPYIFYAAWGPDSQYQVFPKLIRITVGIDDHEGRLSEPQMFEFVYEVQQ